MQSPEIGRNESAAATSNRLPRLIESDTESSLSDVFTTDSSDSNTGTANDMGVQDEHRSPHTEGNDDMTDHFSLNPPFSDPWRDHSRNDSIHNSNELDPHKDSNPPNFNKLDPPNDINPPNFNKHDPSNDSNPPNFNRNLESHQSSSSLNPLSTTPPYPNNTNTFSRVSSQVTQKIHDSISELSPIDVNRHITQIMHERCRQFKVDMDFVREMLGNNLAQAQKDLDEAHQAVKLFEIGLQEAESRRDTVHQTSESAASRNKQARTVYIQHEALKDFGKDFCKDTAFRSDISILAEQLHSKWTEIEEEVENATESLKLAYIAATDQDKALQKLEAAGVPLREREEKAKEIRDTCKGTLESMHHGSPGLAEMMMRTFAGILPQDVFASERNTSAGGSDGAKAT